MIPSRLPCPDLAKSLARLLPPLPFPRPLIKSDPSTRYLYNRPRPFFLSLLPLPPSPVPLLPPLHSFRSTLPPAPTHLPCSAPPSRTSTSAPPRTPTSSFTQSSSASTPKSTNVSMRTNAPPFALEMSTCGKRRAQTRTRSVSAWSGSQRANPGPHRVSVRCVPQPPPLSFASHETPPRAGLPHVL